MPEQITLTQDELKEIKNESAFRAKTTLLLKKIEDHQVKQNGNIESTMNSVNKAFVKIASNTTSIKIYWGLFAIVFGAIMVLFRIK